MLFVQAGPSDGIPNLFPQIDEGCNLLFQEACGSKDL